MPCHLLYIPEGIRICDWMPRCLVQAFGESSDFTSCSMPTRFEDWKNTLSILTLLLPLPPPPRAVLTSQPMLMVRIIFSGISIDWLSDDCISYPSKPMLWFSFYCLLRKKGCPGSERQRTWLRVNIASPFMRVFTLHMSTGFSLPLREQGLQFYILTMSCAHLTAPSTPQGCSPHFHVQAHLPLTPSHSKVLHRTTALS